MAQRSRTTETQIRPPGARYGLSPQIDHDSPTWMAEPSKSTRRYSATSPISPLQSSSKSAIPRPTAVPRLKPAAPPARTQAIPIRSPPVSAIEQKPSPILDEKSRSAKRESVRAMPLAQMKQSLSRRDDGFVLQAMSTSSSSMSTGLSLQDGVSKRQSQLPPRLIPELQALAYTNRRPAQTPSSISSISSPSSQFTGSPSPWSASTTTTTSTSWSSASPSILQATRSPVSSKRSYTVPIPAFSRTPMPSLPHREETTSTSTKVTQARQRTQTATPPRKLRKSPAPTPPPRSSSVKRSRSRSSSKSEAQPSDAHDGNQTPPPPLPVRSEQRSNFDAHDGQMKNSDFRGPPQLAAYHHDLQDALQYGTETSAARVYAQKVVSSPDLFDGASSSLTGARTLLRPAPIETKPRDDATSPSVSTARSRLAKFSKIALFSRSPKDQSATDEGKSQPRKLQRKGPTAGTGHEGYGRYGRKPRKSSSDLNNPGTDSEGSVRSTSVRPDRSTARKYSSSSSRRDRNSQSDLDDFAATRMKPVVIKGGSNISTGHGRNSFSSLEPSGMAKAQNIGKSPSIGDDSLYYAKSPADSLGHMPDLIPDQPLYDSPSSISNPMSMTNTLETYRLPEATRQQSSSNSKPYMDSWNVSQSSFAPSYITSTDAGSDIFRVESAPLEKQRKKIRRSKWNIFRRRDASIESNISVMEKSTRQPSAEVAVAVSHVPVSRPVPYYAMLDAEHEATDVGTIDNLLTEAAHTFEADDESDNGDHHAEEDFNTRERIESVLLPSAPQFKRELSRSRSKQKPALRLLEVSQNMPSTAARNDIQRPSRLPQIGRIPKVVAASHTGQLNRKSFSRPFDRSEPMGNREFNPVGVSPQASVVPDLLPRTAYVISGERKQSTASSRDSQSERAQPVPSFVDPFKFHDRQSMTSSSSDGMISVMGPSLIPPQSPVSAPISQRPLTLEEDVWNEYDDLLDHVITNAPAPQVTPQLRERARISSGEWQSGKVPSLGDNAPSLIALAKGLAIDTSVAQIPIILASPLTEDSFLEQEVHLRRSRIISALHSSMDPSSPFSIGDYLVDHGDRQRDSDYRSIVLSTTSGSGATTPKTSGPSIALPAIPDHRDQSNALQINNRPRAKNLARQSELSYASLMISRWLSFGQVLFSPAHLEIQRQPERQVLVIDGLGNEDWSIYCAVTYQSEHAYVYDLKEINHNGRPATPKMTNVPPNFRRREIGSFNNTFNFPDNFFSAVVLRFPPVMAESKLKNIISECRRVLAPGGHMELMLLDLDIVNMGVLTRRALRALKTKMTTQEPDISLRPLIDNVQNVLGEKGFIKLNRCVVGVPVVGTVVNSNDSPVSSRSSGGSEGTQFSATSERHSFDNVPTATSPAFSLNHLVADHSEGADAKISKLVSRTARSWWQRCFENAVTSSSKVTTSTLANKQVLTECKSRASNFKLLIAYAQKPLKPAVEAKRRTMSEPYITTPAPS